MSDEGFLAEFTKAVGEPPSPTSGDDMQKLRGEIFGTPPDVGARLKKLLTQQK